MPVTVGTPILTANDSVGDVARAPLASSALLSEKQLTAWSPTPLTATRAVLPGDHWSGPPSSEQ